MFTWVVDLQVGNDARRYWGVVAQGQGSKAEGETMAEGLWGTDAIDMQPYSVYPPLWRGVSMGCAGTMYIMG